MKKKLKDFFSEFLNKKFLISIIVMMLCQGLIYFFIKYLESDYHYIYSVIDKKIPFIPYFVYVYDLWYPSILLIMYYIFCKDRKNYYKGVIACVIGYLICDIVFLSYPTIMDAPVVNYNDLDWFTGLVMKLTIVLDDPPINCLPSIHCLFCYQIIFTTWMTKDIKKKFKIPVTLWMLLIVATTMLVKKHYFYDAAASLGVFIIANFITYKFKLYPKLTNKLKKVFKLEDKDNKKVNTKKKNKKKKKK